MPALRPQKTKCQASIVIREVTDPVRHAEGPVWDYRTQNLYFVDTFDATALKYDPKTTQVQSFKIEDHDTIGVIFPKKDDPSKFLIGADRDVYDFTWKPEDNEGNLAERLRLEKDKPKNQFNDGKVDSDGNIWIGTLTRENDLSVTLNGGCLYRIQMPEMTAVPKVPSTSISNGIAWSGDDRFIFHIDSADRIVYRYDFDLKSGTISNQLVLFGVAEYPDIEGIPDGMTIDSDDNLWVAIFGGWKVLKIDSNSGKLLQIIKMPVQYITSCCWGGGPNYDILYVTTSRLHLNEEQLEEQPSAGAVFEILGLGVTGTPCNLLN